VRQELCDATVCEIKEVQQIIQWAVDTKTPHTHVNRLLKILQLWFLSSLPLCTKTLLWNNVKCDPDAMAVSDGSVGEFYYFGIKDKLKLTVNPKFHETNLLELIINVDGISLFTSSKVTICSVGHGAFKACERCNVIGEKVNKVTVFLQSDETKTDTKTDDDFRSFEDPDYHTGPSLLILIHPPIIMLDQFILNPMHLIYLGCTNMILEYLLKSTSKHKVCLSSALKDELNQRSVEIQNYKPEEFPRKMRSQQKIILTIKLWSSKVGIQGSLQPLLVIFDIMQFVIRERSTSFYIRRKVKSKKIVDEAANIYGSTFISLNITEALGFQYAKEYLKKFIKFNVNLNIRRKKTVFYAFSTLQNWYKCHWLLNILVNKETVMSEDWSECESESVRERDVLYDFSLVKFIKKGRPSVTREMDIVPTKWIGFSKQKVRCTVKYPSSSSNPEDCSLLHDLVQVLAVPSENWKENKIAIKGRVRTYADALKTFEVLKTEEHCLCASDEGALKI
ncbi:hypothetical protein TSAR_008077, partial [Trichomalopsis sarcophagae]